MTTKGITSPTVGTTNWDVPLNANFTAIEKAFGDVTSITATAGTSALTATQVGFMCLRCVGALTANLTLQVPSGTAGQWVVQNNTTDASGGPWKLFITSAAGGTPIEIERGKTRSVYADGSSSGVVFADTPFTAGSNSEIIFNNAGTLTGSAALTTNGSTLTASALSADFATGNWIATQAEAEVGTSNDQVMTPVRVLQSILYRNQGSIGGASGWVSLPGGLILQWGPFSTPNPAGATQLITLPVAYPNGFIAAYVGVYNASLQMIGVVNPTNTQITIQKGNSDTGVRTGWWLTLGH